MYENRTMSHASDLQKLMPPNEWKLRRMLFGTVAADPVAYGDDGELQYNRPPHIDFLRDAPDDIDGKMAEHMRRRFAESQAAASETREALAQRDQLIARLEKRLAYLENEASENIGKWKQRAIAKASELRAAITAVKECFAEPAATVPARAEGTEDGDK